MSRSEEVINPVPVHYIWLGKIDTPYKIAACVLGPQSLARHLPEQPITMWVNDALLAPVKELFDSFPNITVRSIDQWLAGELGYIAPLTNNCP